jgi:uncharacterized membrane protein
MGDIAILSADGFPFLMRWFHFIAGITWIGLLYYFNFVQGAFFAETTPEVKTGATQKLVPRALWWFRQAAATTFVTGLLILVAKIITGGGAVMSTSWGVCISIGALLGTLMMLNVWLIIWPNQQVVIAKANGEDTGGRDPVACGNRAFVASRTNTLFSFPMLFFMAAASHLTLFGTTTPIKMGVGMAAVSSVIGLFEVNAIFGEKGKGAAAMLEKHQTTIYMGLALTGFFYLVLDLVV